MTGFSAEWLALREPADHAAINAGVRRALRHALAGRPHVRVVDLGCGAGSNLRGLALDIDGRQSWTLVDYDARLLSAAKSRLASDSAMKGLDVTFRRADLASGDFASVIAGADLVTAAALFDLVSEAVIGKLAAAIAANKQMFATVLTYDGIASFLPEHPADTAMREAFNQHQQTDKGFGPAAGPAATATLARAFAAHGYRIVRGKSPWVLDATAAELRRQLDTGWAAAVRETGRVPEADVAAWLAHRLDGADRITIVGHEDILALPPTT